MDNDFSEKLGTLLSDPAALAKIASLAGSLGLGGAPAPAQEKKAERECSECPAKEIMPCGGAPCPFPKKDGLSDAAKSIAQSRALLTALKPYLSSERCERIDKILGMMKIAEIMGYLK
ncbi:MAG: hypothetical protein IJW21_03525 [Clostridia bacterium]|nr:hypothetical protein [Clostridia bacterium]